MTTPVDLAGIIERTEDEIRRRGMLVDTFGPEHHYVPKAGDGHDDYDCAAADRRALLGLLRETREALLWTLRNNGGECPADHPAGYVKAMRAALALSALAEP